MTAAILDGNAFLASMKEDLAARVRMIAKQGITPGLGTILVGADPNSASYVRRKHTNCEEIGIASIHEELLETATQAEVLAAVDRFNANPAVDVLIVQLPLPKGIDEAEVLLRIDPAKDADGLHPVNLGRLVMGVEAPVPYPRRYPSVTRAQRRGNPTPARRHRRTWADHRAPARVIARTETAPRKCRGDGGAHGSQRHRIVHTPGRHSDSGGGTARHDYPWHG